MQLEFQKVTKSFGSKQIIQPLDLTVQAGEFIVLLGPSGCGKSTVLRMISGLEDVSSGVIRMAGKEINHLPPKDRDLAMVFQSYALYPHMTVRENMSFGLKMRSMDRQEITKRVEKAATYLRLTEYLDRKPSSLSGGQRQRVAMGRALVRKPKLFLFDEPLSNLDAKLRVELRAEIRKLHQTERATVIYVTHDQEEAMTLADRIVILRDGKIEQAGPPLEIYQRPANVFVAEFLGNPKMNFIDADVAAPHSSISLGEFFLDTSGFKASKLKLGFRPGDVTLERKKDSVSLGHIRVNSIEALGHVNVLHGDIDGQNITLTTASSKPSASSYVEGYIQPDRLKVFDRDTGLSIY